MSRRPDPLEAARMAKSIRQYFLYPLIVLLIFFAFLELSLRAAAFAVKNRGETSRGRAHIRILCLGDSFTFGMGAPAGKSYPAQLGERLNSSCGFSVNVINRGVPGLNSSYIRAHFEENLIRYRPDVVLFMAGVNNPWNITDA